MIKFNQTIINVYKYIYIYIYIPADANKVKLRIGLENTLEVIRCIYANFPIV